MLGPLAAGALVATLGASAAIAVDAATFGVSALLLLGLRLERVQRTTRESFLRELRDGWSAVRSRSWVWASLSAFAVFNVVWGPFWVLGPLLARRDLGGASAWATIVAGVGLGSVAGSLLATRFRPRRPLVAAHAAVVAAAPVFCALALDAPAGVIAALAIPMGLGLALGNTLWETTLQERIPRASLSRVSAYDWLASMAFAPIGMTIAGPIADAVGIGTTLVAAAVLVAAIEAVALAVPGIRAIRRTTDATAESAERQPQPQAA
jgi:predicted MFS family arabinose efflux permease